MPDIRYVCLSDLHFGAENSLLSALVDGKPVVDPTTASPVLEAFVDVMRALIAGNADQTRPPTLILNGDVLELALASDNVALMVCDLFLDRIFPEDGAPLFDPTIIYLPGNHDHHMWETARERQYGDFLAALDPSAQLPVPWHTTRLYYQDDPQPVSAQLLNQLVRRRPYRRDIDFRVSYPNLGLRSDGGETAVIFHHGHFVESIYHLMTTLKDLIFPGRVEPSEVWDIEAENFAWIDFFWSTLGRSGDVGADVGLIYDLLQSDAATKSLARNVGEGIARRLPHMGALGLLRGIERPLLDDMVERVASRISASERLLPTVALSPASSSGLSAYLSGPVTRQLGHETRPGQGPPDCLKFVFGHTHKPFIDERPAGAGSPVRIFNSGGWVVDTPEVEPLQGANLVLLDDDLEVACVRMYNQVAGAPPAVHLDAGLPAEQGPFYEHLQGVLASDQPAWRDFPAIAMTAVLARRQALETILAYQP